MGKAKPFDIPKREVWEAFKRVKANQGAAGVDAQSIAEFEVDLSNNLYTLWNRLSSGSARHRAHPSQNRGPVPAGARNARSNLAPRQTTFVISGWISKIVCSRPAEAERRHA